MGVRRSRVVAWGLVIAGIAVLIAATIVLRRGILDEVRELQPVGNDGVGSFVLSPEAATGSGRGEFSGAGTGKQNYTITRIDTRAFSNGGLLVVGITIGPGESAGSFDLFGEDVDVPEDPAAQEQLRVSHSLAHSYDVQPTMEGQLVHPFQAGEVFQLGATGNWFSRQGAQNTFELDVRIVGPDELEKALRDPAGADDPGGVPRAPRVQWLSTVRD